MVSLKTLVKSDGYVFWILLLPVVLVGCLGPTFCHKDLVVIFHLCGFLYNLIF